MPEPWRALLRNLEVRSETSLGYVIVPVCFESGMRNVLWGPLDVLQRDRQVVLRVGQGQTLLQDLHGELLLLQLHHGLPGLHGISPLPQTQLHLSQLIKLGSLLHDLLNSMLTCLITYLRTYLLTYFLTYLLNYLLTD